MASRKRRKKESPVKAVFLALIAVVIMVCAVSVVMSVYRKISKDYENLEQSISSSETPGETIAIENGVVTGWQLTDDGYRYVNEDETYATDTWKLIDGLLYHFDENGIMSTGELSQEGQKFTFSDKGYLKDIQADLSWQPESTGENLDSLVKANAFFCYLGEADGPFKPIMYRKATETKVMTLGGESAPERTTRNSMRAYGDYVYYLPKVKSGQAAGLTDEELRLCDSLFRMIPGSGEKELIAEHVGGYLLLDNVIYYSQGSTVKSASSGTKIAVGEKQYRVIVKDGSCFMVDGMNQPVRPDSSGVLEIGDRIYRIENDQGKIKYVKRAQEQIGGASYYTDTVSGQYQGIFRKDSGGASVIVQEPYGVQSYCIAGQKIYYSAYVEKDGSGVWYSQLFKTALDGSGKEEVSGRFPGMIGTMYYYENAGEIYGEYHPEIWNRAYGRIVSIGLDGTIYTINDEAARTGQSVSDNDMLELVMVDGDTVTCLWHDVVWNRSTGITSTLWDKAVQIKKSDRTLLETGQSLPPEEETEAQTDEQDGVVIRPIGGEPTAAPDADKPTAANPGAAPNPGVDPNADKPTMPAASPDADKPTTPAVPPATTAPAQDEVIIKPVD